MDRAGKLASKGKHKAAIRALRPHRKDPNAQRMMAAIKGLKSSRKDFEKAKHDLKKMGLKITVSDFEIERK